MSEVNTIVIGVLTQDVSVGQKKKFAESLYTSSLGASYVKFIEDCGGQCLPIAQNQTLEYYQHIVSIVHAVLLPGGGPHLTGSKGYLPSGILLLDAVTCAAKRGRVVPVFGICLGYELMAVYFGSTENVLSDILTQYRPSVTGWKELDFPDVSPRLISPQQFEELKKNSLVNFLHEMCITSKTFDERLKEEWQVLATNDLKTTEIYQGLGDYSAVVSRGETLTAVTMMESKSKPYFGVQFHPEKTRHFSTEREGIIVSPLYTAIFKQSQLETKITAEKSGCLRIAIPPCRTELLCIRIGDTIVLYGSVDLNLKNKIPVFVLVETHVFLNHKCHDIAKAETAARVFVSSMTGMIKAQDIPLTFPEAERVRLIDRFKPEDVRAENSIQLDYVYMFREGDLM